MIFSSMYSSYLNTHLAWLALLYAIYLQLKPLACSTTVFLLVVFIDKLRYITINQGKLMKKDLIIRLHKEFEGYVKREKEVEFWYARDLQKH